MSTTKTKPKKPASIGQSARRLLATKKPYQDILEVLHNEFPDANTTIGSLRWYASKMRKDEMKVPVRARAVRGDG